MGKEFDAIVVGGGGSGLAAAVSAAENGLRVLLLEKQPQLGGTTGIAVGSFTANRTRAQQRASIEDDLQAHVEDAGKFPPPEHEARNNTALRARFLEHTAQTLDWLEGMGLVFQGPSPEPPNRVPRMHNVVPSAKAYIAVLHGRFMRLGGTVLTSAAVQELLLEQGRVVGVRVARKSESNEYRARRGVVLAAGDYANARDLIAEFKGHEFAVVDGINPHALGDGHRLARSVGARLCNMDITYGPELRFVAPSRRSFQQLLPASGWPARVAGWLLPLVPQPLIAHFAKRLLVTWQHPEDALFRDGAVLVNARGERFCNEVATPDREIAVAQQPHKQAYILLDERLCQRYSHWPHFISTAPEIAYAYVRDYQRLRPDITRRAATLSELASAGGIAQSPLQNTVETFNAYIAGAAPDPWGRAGDRYPLAGNNWVLLGPTQAYFTTTEGGAALDEHLQVLNDFDKPIAGLYAVGQNGLGGQVLWGHGLHIAWAMTSGRLVGQHLANQAVQD